MTQVSETNQKLRREALKIFKETQTNRQSETVQYSTEEYRYKRSIFPSKETPQVKYPIINNVNEHK